MEVNLLIPMAGLGSRFSQCGYTRPKPLIKVAGKEMIKWVIDNFQCPGVQLHYIFVVRREHEEEYNLKEALTSFVAPQRISVVFVDQVTEGAACTCLLATELIDNQTPLIIANSDQFMEWDAAGFFHFIKEQKDTIDGSILTFTIPMENNDTKWSYAQVDQNGNVTLVKEKEVISEHATVGVYHWARGADFVMAAKTMIEKNIRVKGEFYVCPVYNENIALGQKIKIYDCDKMWGLGTPEDLVDFLQNYPPVKGAVVEK